jgi:hypothetical protein
MSFHPIKIAGVIVAGPDLSFDSGGKGRCSLVVADAEGRHWLVVVEGNIAAETRERFGIGSKVNVDGSCDPHRATIHCRLIGRKEAKRPARWHDQDDETSGLRRFLGP